MLWTCSFVSVILTYWIVSGFSSPEFLLEEVSGLKQVNIKVWCRRASLPNCYDYYVYVMCKIWDGFFSACYIRAFWSLWLLWISKFCAITVRMLKWLWNEQFLQATVCFLMKMRMSSWCSFFYRFFYRRKSAFWISWKKNKVKWSC